MTRLLEGNISVILYLVPGIKVANAEIDANGRTMFQSLVSKMLLKKKATEDIIVPPLWGKSFFFLNCFTRLRAAQFVVLVVNGQHAVKKISSCDDRPDDYR